MTPELDEQLDRLFQTPLADFVVARNALAATLKKGGDPEGSARVKEIPKPSPSAWAVNQLYWRARSIFEALLAAGDEYRRAQRDGFRDRDTERWLEAERNRSVAIEETIRQVLYLFEERGQPPPSDAVLGRIKTTLEALASYGTGNPNAVTGRLTSDLEPPGFGALATLAPPLPPAAAEPDRDERQHEERRRAAKQRLEEAERALAVARNELERVRARVAELEMSAEAARNRLELLESGEAARERK
jgi:hypothetical protein